MKMVLYFSGFPLKNTVNQPNCEENIRQVQTGEYSTKYLTSTLQMFKVIKKKGTSKKLQQPRGLKET